MKRVVLQIAVLAAALILICVGCRLTIHNTFADHITFEGRARGSVRVSTGAKAGAEEAVLLPGDPRVEGDGVRLDVHPQRSGEAWLTLRDGAGETLSEQHYRVDRFLTVYDYDTGGFTGDGVVMVCLTIFWLGTAAIMLWAFFGAKGPAFYAYDTIYYVGFFLFSLITGLTMLVLTLRRFIQPEEFLMLDAYSALSGAGFQFMLVTLPLMVVFAVAMAVSNLAMLRHERASLKNVLGLGVALALLVGEALGIWMQMTNMPTLKLSFWTRVTISNVYTTMFAYFECMLAGAVVCGTLAARREPSRDRDFIVILGCWFRKDGTLPPQLKGRVDRALAFWHAQKAETGREAVLVPSGGQGADESMPEAQAMRRYLLEQGMPESLILAEDRSTNTYQNMEFSKRLIEAAGTGGKVAFATTNYHVFRSGVWARRAGLEAEGVGSKIRWWYWPNAYMRECAGLVKNRWKQELLLIAALSGLFGLLTMVLR